MCFGGSPKPPVIQQSAPIPPPVTTEVIDQDALNVRDRERRRQRGAAGRQSTMLTGPGGVATPTGASKSLLGS